MRRTKANKKWLNIKREEFTHAESPRGKEETTFKIIELAAACLKCELNSVENHVLLTDFLYTHHVTCKFHHFRYLLEKS